MATGWLGWTPEVALDTPIPLIELALDGRTDFVRRTNPFGSAPNSGGRAATAAPAAAPDKATMTQGLAAFLRARKRPGGAP
ncbi:hypothetical protein [Azospirillum argentinense]|uniref:hypothetical protein n=2 Tax=Pseudomonadota TaxID=1224 RepID=UPI00190DAA90|nr:hypothetical protein [Azospirillum argentinense]